MSKRTQNEDIESYILHLLEIHTRVTVSELCEKFGLASSTVRKKLSELEQQGQLIRSYGGAISVDANRDETMEQKSRINLPQKKAIASAAIELIDDGDTLVLTGGSTVAALCVYMRKLKNSTILTNSIVVANLIMDNPNLEVRINSGIVRGRTGCIVGPTACNLFESTHVDKAFVSCDAFDMEHGAFSSNILVGKVEHCAIMSASQRYLLCDSSKLNKHGISPFLPMKELTALITDDDADPYYINDLRQSGLEVIVAPVFRMKKTIRDIQDSY